MTNHMEVRNIALISNTSWSLYNFRLGLIKKLIKAGYSVLVIAPVDKYTPYLIENGCKFAPIELDNYGYSPWQDFKSFLAFLKLYQKQKIDFIFHYTIKPNIYGTLAATILKIPSIAVVTGLGHLFTNPNWKTAVAKILYKVAFSKIKKVWFLNESDATIFTQKAIVSESKIEYLPSEGINTKYFQQYAYGLLSNGNFKFLLASRLIVDKGVYEYVEAARILKKRGCQIEFQLLGFIEPQNPQHISLKTIQQWEAEGLIRYLGTTDDIRPYLEKIDCLVLPTYYREGIPRILMEGASMQIPLIATDNVGCRQVVEDCVNGFLCKRKNPEDLAKCMEKMISLTHQERTRFGLLGRRRVYTLYHENIIINKYLRTLNKHFKVPANRLQILSKDKTSSNVTTKVSHLD